MSYLKLDRVNKSFGVTPVLHDIDLVIDEGQFVSLIGPSGSGKTTTLRILAGSEVPTSGSVLLNGEDITGLPPHKRGFAMVFQHFALFPHKDVFQNVAYGLQVRKVPRREIERQVLDLLEGMGMREFAHRRIGELSGGQRQRVGIARALVVSPKLVLLDEPTGSLDAKLRLHMQTELKMLHRDLGLTFVHVTHNQSEALALADRVFVMNAGRIEQSGPPDEVFTSPATRFVADFVGRNNLVEGSGEDGEFVSAIARYPVDTGVRGPCTAVVRADSIHVGRAPDGAVEIQARLEALEYGGSVVTWLLAVDGTELTADVPTDESRAMTPTIGEQYRVWWRPGDVHYLAGG